MSKKWEELTKKEKRSAFIVIGIVALILIGIFSGGNEDELIESDKEEVETEPVLTEAEQKELERKKSIKAQFHFWDGSHINLT